MTKHCVRLVAFSMINDLVENCAYKVTWLDISSLESENFQIFRIKCRIRKGQLIRLEEETIKKRPRELNAAPKTVNKDTNSKNR